MQLITDGFREALMSPRVLEEPLDSLLITVAKTRDDRQYAERKAITDYVHDAEEQAMESIRVSLLAVVNGVYVQRFRR